MHDRCTAVQSQLIPEHKKEIEGQHGYFENDVQEMASVWKIFKRVADAHAKVGKVHRRGDTEEEER